MTPPDLNPYSDLPYHVQQWSAAAWVEFGWTIRQMRYWFSPRLHGNVGGPNG